MHLKGVTISKIRNFDFIEWRIPGETLSGWHVIIGDNGSGKSSFLRSIALVLVGPAEAPALRQDWNSWLQKGRNSGWIKLVLDGDRHFDHWQGKGRQLKNFYITAQLDIKKDAETEWTSTAATQPAGAVLLKPKKSNAHRTVWSGKPGWFSAAYGPYRRFTGGDKDAEKMFYSHPRISRHLSVFREDVALSESIVWLQELKFKELDEQQPDSLLAAVVRFVNESAFLPHECKIADITSKEVIFVDPRGVTVALEELSDGFRAILSMTFEVIRQMTLVFEKDELFDPSGTQITVPGVILIDEVGAHLHPTWHRRIGLWFREHFPNMQFIVTTHSPLVCQAADIGTVFKLPTPRSGEKAAMVTGNDLDRLLYGSALDAYGTEMFGANIAPSEPSLRIARQ